MATCPTAGPAGHLSVILREADGTSIFFAGDASYSQELMLEQVVDGVGPDPAAARDTISRIYRYVTQNLTVYLPSHDPGAPARLQHRVPALPLAGD